MHTGDTIALNEMTNRQRCIHRMDERIAMQFVFKWDLFLRGFFIPDVHM